MLLLIYPRKHNKLEDLALGCGMFVNVNKHQFTQVMFLCSCISFLINAYNFIRPLPTSPLLGRLSITDWCNVSHNWWLDECLPLKASNPVWFVFDTGVHDCIFHVSSSMFSPLNDIYFNWLVFTKLFCLSRLFKNAELSLLCNFYVDKMIFMKHELLSNHFSLFHWKSWYIW